MTSVKNVSRKKSFSSFNYKAAFKQLKIDHLLSWEIEFQPVSPSEFFQQHLERLKCFDLESSEESKKLLIDAVLVEAIQGFKRLKIWKGAPLDSDDLNGEVDYMIAENRAYLDTPLLCVVEAKRDDFLQGLAQCLVEMQACRWVNMQIDKAIDILGIVTNGDTWKFYKLTLDSQVYESSPHAIGDIDVVLGLLHTMFEQCEHNLDK